MNCLNRAYLTDTANVDAEKRRLLFAMDANAMEQKPENRVNM
jgi:hypothetical protein